MKQEEKLKKQVWAEKYIDSQGQKRWAIHYIKYNTEYKFGKYYTKQEALASEDYKLRIQYAN